MHEHEYSVLGGINRSIIGRYLSLIAATLSISAAVVILTIIKHAEFLEIRASLPPTFLSLAMAGAIFAGLYSLFDLLLWRCWPINAILKVPDLGGKWNANGQTLNSDGTQSFTWKGMLTIVQSWDKLRVHLRTDQSVSNSFSAAIVCDEVDGFRLLYSYANEPRLGQVELSTHRGFAELTFAKDRQSAEGEYFNGRGRQTSGTIRLTREKS